MKMKNTIRLVFAVMLGITVFSVTAAADESADAFYVFETAVSAVTETDETFNREGSLFEAEVTEDDTEETAPELSLLPAGIFTDKNEDETPAKEENDTLTDILTGVFPEVPTVSNDESPDSIFDNSIAETPDISLDGIFENILPSAEEENPPEAGSETGAVPSDTGLDGGKKRFCTDGLVLSGKDIPLENGKYSYELIMKLPEKLYFDNYLENLYQGVAGKYKLHYEIAESDNHIMIATGMFKNILKASPLLTMYRDMISEDFYSYQLDLRTSEGFTFTNNLRYLFNGEERGYSIYFNYDLLTNKQTFEIGKPWDEVVESEHWLQRNPLQKLQGIFPLLFLPRLYSNLSRTDKTYRGRPSGLLLLYCFSDAAKHPEYGFGSTLRVLFFDYSVEAAENVG